MAPRRFKPPPSRGKPAYFKTPEEMADKIAEYFNSLINVPVMEPDGKGGEIQAVDPDTLKPIYENPPPLLCDLVSHLGFCDLQSLKDYEKRPEYSGLIKSARNYVFGHHERRLSSGGNCQGSIHWTKQHGWSDKVDSNNNTNMNHSGSIEVKKSVVFSFKDMPGHLIKIVPPEVTEGDSEKVN